MALVEHLGLKIELGLPKIVAAARLHVALATSWRKNAFREKPTPDGPMELAGRTRKGPPGEPGGGEIIGGRWNYSATAVVASFLRVRTLPILIRLSPITPSPTQRCMPRSPLSRQRLSPWRRFTTLMRPSQPVRHFCPLRNHGFFWSRFRSALLVLRLGTQTRLTPLSCAAFSLLAE